MTPQKYIRPTGAADEIDWLFRECEALMGVKSNFDSGILAMKLGSSRKRLDDSGDLTNGVQEDAYNEDSAIDQLDARRAMSRRGATAKNRRILRAYSIVHPMHQRLLEAAFEARQYPPEVRDFYGDLAGLTPLTATARSSARFDMAWLAKALVRRDPLVLRIRTEAQALMNVAIAGYQRAKVAIGAADPDDAPPARDTADPHPAPLPPLVRRESRKRPAKPAGEPTAAPAVEVAS